MNRLIVPAVLAAALAAPAAFADRVQVYSIRGADCGSCGDHVIAELKKVDGVKKSSFDIHKVELTATLDAGVADEVVLAAIERAGLEGIVGAGKGAYLPHAPFPEGTDFAVLSADGSPVGPLDKLRAAGKYTIFDVYADWCGPCRAVDARLREIVGERDDVAVRKLNVIKFDTPLAKEFGSRLKALPYVVVYSPGGKRTDIVGIDWKKLDAALAVKR